MSEWDASDHEDTRPSAPLAVSSVVAIKKNKWADEDADEDVKEDWEASEDDSDLEKQKSEFVKPKGPIRNKGITKMKIAEKETEEANKLAELEALAEVEANPILKRKKEHERTVESDLENARGLFGDAVISKNIEDPFKMDPKTKSDFEALSTAFAELITTRHGNKPLYPVFVEHFIKQIAAPLSDVQTRKASSALTTLANEKQRQAKESKKGGKGKAKPALGGLGVGGASAASKGGRGINADLEAYDQALDDEYDDFM